MLGQLTELHIYGRFNRVHRCRRHLWPSIDARQGMSGVNKVRCQYRDMQYKTIFRNTSMQSVKAVITHLQLVVAKFLWENGRFCGDAEKQRGDILAPAQGRVPSTLRDASTSSFTWGEIFTPATFNKSLRPNTLQQHLDTRFTQLNTSFQLELWPEVFRSIEDIDNLLMKGKMAPRSATISNYYQIFLISSNTLYHAAAWARFYALATSIGGKSNEKLSKLWTGVQKQDEVKRKLGRLTAPLGLAKMPTRAGLLKGALSRDVLKISSTSVKPLYDMPRRHIHTLLINSIFKFLEMWQVLMVPTNPSESNRLGQDTIGSMTKLSYSYSNNGREGKCELAAAQLPPSELSPRVQPQLHIYYMTWMSFKRKCFPDCINQLGNPA
ncbi:hypothetical protein EDD85DRAFT_788978 [Armillaria nabsnona]|nr:hypothetical protein EDD85DRAFT_788978 [Armillaria nabsnona]